MRSLPPYPQSRAGFLGVESGGPVPTTGGHRAQGEGLPSSPASTALREDMGVGGLGGGAQADKRLLAPITAANLDCSCRQNWRPR